MTNIINVRDFDDRISDLPDGVISNILSRLPTIQAMRTSALSRDWQHKWTYIYDIDIHEDEIIHVLTYLELDESDQARYIASFQGFVDKVLDSNRCSRIRSVSVSIGYLHSYESDYVSRLVSRLVNLNLEKLSIACNEDLGIVLPTLFECSTSLTELSVALGCSWEVRVKNCFPKLRRLYLGGGSDGFSVVSITNEQSPKTDQLLLIFPVLEDFELGSTFDFLDVKFVEIDTPELISFKVSGQKYPSDFVIKIRAPKLVRFVTYSGPAYDFILRTPSLRHVEYLGHFTESETSQVTTLLKGAPDLEFLLLIAEILTDHALPTYNQLKQLKGEVREKDLWKLLRATPYLESLSMQIIEDEDFSYSPELEPFLPLPELKHVTLGGFQGGKSQLALVRLFLEKAKKLDGVVVYSSSCVGMEEVKIRLTSLGPEHSSRVTVLEGE